MSSEEYWEELITDVLMEISPRSDVDEVVNLISIEESQNQRHCTARVNATAWIERTRQIELGDTTVQVTPQESTGIGEQRLDLKIVD